MSLLIPRLRAGFPFLSLLGLALVAAPARADDQALARRTQQAAETAREDLEAQERRWRSIREAQERSVSRFQAVALTPAGVEDAFQRFIERSMALGAARTQISGGSSGTGTGVTATGSGGGDPSVLGLNDIIRGESTGTGGSTGTSTSGTGTGTGGTGTGTGSSLGLGELAEDEQVLLRVAPSLLLLRIRAYLKTEALEARGAYGEFRPLLGLHPYQVWLIAERVTASGDLALNETLTRLGDLFTRNPLRYPADGLTHAYGQQEPAQILRGFATYLFYRSWPENDEKAMETARKGLRDLSLDGLVGDQRPGPPQLVFASLVDMMVHLEASGLDDAKQMDILFGVFIDYQLALFDLSGRLRRRNGGTGDGDRRERILASLTLDPVLSGYEIVPPVRDGEAQTSPFGDLDAREHLRRLRHFSDRLADAREKMLAALQRIEEAEGARDQNSRTRLQAEVSRLTYGGDPQRPEADSIMGILGSPEFQAERRYLLAQGPSNAPGVSEAYRRIFGDESSQPPLPGELDRIFMQLRGTILPFLRQGRVRSGEEPPRTPAELLTSHRELAGLRSRLDEIDRRLLELARLPQDDPRRREAEPLMRERERLLGEYDQTLRQLEPRSPRDLTDRARQVDSWLRSGRVPDGEGGTRSITPDERRVLQDEARRIDRALNPTADEARRRGDILDEALRRGTDLRGDPITDPRIADELREERDRMRGIARGQQQEPPGLRPSDRDLFPPRDDPFQRDPRSGGTDPGSGGTGFDRPSDLSTPPSRQPPRTIPGSDRPMTQDPNTGNLIDPSTNRQIGEDGRLGDPPTGQPIDPITRRPADPRTGQPLPVDPNTNNPVDPRTGNQVDPRTGEQGPPATGTPLDPVTREPIQPSGTGTGTGNSTGTSTGTGAGPGSTSTGPGAPTGSDQGQPRTPGSDIGGTDNSSGGTDNSSGGTGGSSTSGTGTSGTGGTGGSDSTGGSTGPDPAELEARIASEYQAWIAGNGGNTLGMPPGASQAEIIQMLRAAAPPPPAGFSYNERGQLVGGNSSGTASAAGSPDGGSAWPASARATVAAELQGRIEAQQQSIRQRVYAEAGGRSPDGPASTATGR